MMHADHTTVCFSNSNAMKMEKVLTEVGQLSSWIVTNGLKINPMMNLSRNSREDEAKNLYISTDNESFAKYDEVKFLGVIVYKQLNCRSHIDMLGGDVSLP